MPAVFALFPFLIAFFLMIFKPLKTNEGTAGLIGAFFMALFGFIGLEDVRAVLNQTGSLMVMLSSMMIISIVVDEAGFFRYFAHVSAAKSGGSGKRLFLNTFLLGLAVTTVISNDATALIITPIVWEYTRSLGLNPLPFLLTCSFIADTGSLSLPVSNLTNLLVYESLGLKFWDYLILMFFPNLIAAIINYLIFAFLFRKKIPKSFDQSLLIKEEIKNPLYFKLTTYGLLVITAGYVVGSFLGLSLMVIALLGAIYMLTVAHFTGKTKTSKILKQVSWPVLFFVFGMFLVVRGLENSGLLSAFGDFIASFSEGGLFSAILATTFGTAVGSNVVNNVPMDMLMVSTLNKIKPVTDPLIFGALPYGVIIGAGLGPNFTIIGSLATMLWLGMVRKKGYDISATEYSYYGFLTAPLMLLGASVALFLVYRLIYL